MKETRIPEISTEMRKRIKKIVRFHYGFKPKDKDIDWIDDMLRNDYVVMHDARCKEHDVRNTLLYSRQEAAFEKKYYISSDSKKNT